MRSLLLFWLLLPLTILAQLSDDFSDGNFTQNPSWSGDINNFEVNENFQLQLNAQGEDIAHLSTIFNMLQETEWQFYIRLAFSPSSNNNARVYLASDQLNTEGPVSGYFLQFGEAGSDDAIELFRQNGEDVVSVARGSNGLIATSFELQVRVRKNQQGNWTIEADPTGTGAYQLEATGTDNTITNSSYFGVFCKYTSSNSTKFYFDDIYAGQYVVDNEPPEFISLNVKSSNSLDLLFDEALKVETAENIQNYFVSGQIANPLVALPDNQNPGLIHLTFDREFPNGEERTITIRNISDIAGNVIEPLEKPFVYFTPYTHDIQINEIMADPNPQVELPDWEYLELYNRTNLPVDLSGWKLIIGTSEKDIENVSIQPDGFLILGDEEAANEFTFNGPFYGFSSFALTNAGQTIVLQNPEGAVISTVTYSDEWYRDPNKEDGGWSLEQIDPQNPCGGVNNWAVSISPYGGTPGAVNSVVADNPDEIPPFAERVEFADTTGIILHFSEPMDSTLLFDVNAYNINNGIGTPVSADPVWPGYKKVILVFEQPFVNNNSYTLEILSNLTDCAGNVIDKGITLTFGLPGEIAPGDIVINEVLFNPSDDYVAGVDFVEIYNRSEKIIDLKKMILATEDEDTGELDAPKHVSEEGFLFFPGTYLVLTTDPDVVKTQYFTENPQGFLKMASLPSYNNDEGVVILATVGFELIDRMAYSEEMHYPLLTSYDGVSLERMNFDRPSEDQTNWHSASETSGFATPAYINSQFSPIMETTDPVTVEPEIFSPDSDGKDDVLNILYNFESGNKNCSINIYDSRGRLVRKLVDNTYVGTSGQFSWDGLNDDSEKAAIGIYVIFVEVFDTDGNRENYKKTAVLGTRF